jgi:glycosyltransferase involved in cell wall biosynthesis
LDNPLLGHVGRFDQPKNQHFLVEVFVALLRELPIARLVLVGDGPLRSQIEDLIRSKGIEDYVYLLGTRKDVPDILAALDLFLFPSLHEGLGIALVEAQAAGAPCVVADTVPREADINIGLVQFVSLRAGMDRWVYAILNSLEMEIPDWPTRKRSLQIAGYDISHTAHLLQEIYTCEQ